MALDHNLELVQPPVEGQTLRLPAELLEIVFAHLPFRSLCLCLLVCRYWNLVASERSQFWTAIDFSQARRNVPLATVQKYIEYAGRLYVTRFVLNNVDLRRRISLSKITTTCVNIQELDISDSGLVLTSGLTHALSSASALRSLRIGRDFALPLEDVQDIFRTFGAFNVLEEARFENVFIKNPVSQRSCPPYVPLKVLEITLRPNGDRPIRLVSFASLIPARCKLRELKVAACQATAMFHSQSCESELEDLEQMHLENLKVEEPISIPKHLQVLNLLADGLTLRMAPHTLPSLHSVNILGHRYGLLWFEVRTILDNVRNLKKLVINVSHFCKQDFVWLLQHASLVNLEALEIHGWFPLKEPKSDRVWRSLCNLKSIKLIGLQIEDDCLDHMTSNLTQLKSLSLEGCNTVRADVMKRIEQRGIDTEVTFGRARRTFDDEYLEWRQPNI